MSFADEMFQGYVECAEWVATASTEADPDNTVSWESIDTDAEPDTTGWFDDVAAFADEFAEITEGIQDLGVWANPAQVGSDFMLTRNGHGTGFWDRYPSGSDLGKLGDRLADAARVWGESNHDWEATDTDGKVWWVYA